MNVSKEHNLHELYCIEPNLFLHDIDIDIDVIDIDIEIYFLFKLIWVIWIFVHKINFPDWNINLHFLNLNKSL